MEGKENNYKKIVELYKLFGEPKELLEVFYDLDYPVTYKGLKIYPVELDLYTYFHILIDCLLQSKNESGDIKAISMSYLAYIIYLAENGNEMYLMKLYELLKICFKLEDTYVYEGKEIPTIDFLKENNKVYLRVLDAKFTSEDFDNIKEIICEQNAIELPDPNIHPDILKAFKDTQEYKRKQSKMKMCSFGEQLNVVIKNTAYKKSDLMSMTIRTFSHLLARIDIQLHYELMTILSPNMDKKGQENITHYLADTSADKYKDLMIDYDSYKSKIQ